MTSDELRAGIKRLGLAFAALILVAGVASLVFLGLGSAGTKALSAGSGVVGIALVLGGVVAFGRTGPIRRTAGVYARASVDDRKEAERLALGLFAGGILFSVFALVLA